MDGQHTVLVVARSHETWLRLADLLADRNGYRVLLVRSQEEAEQSLIDVHVDLAIVDEGVGDDEGLAFLARLRVSHPELIRVAVLRAGSERAPEAVGKASVYQFLRLPLDAEQASLVVKRGLEARELARRHRLLSREFKITGSSAVIEPSGLAPPLRPQSQRFEKLVYVSEKMSEVCEQARSAARTDLPILIQGETGTGKELLARAIHYHSKRRGSPLLIQNCGGIPDSLLQSELFGHRRGAFTGAVSDRLGLFRAADGGTVFLDEISEVSPSFQVSLLRFLQEGEIKPLGADQTTTANVRVIAAANRSLKQLTATGQFRRDLYYRLKGFEFEVPPLRARTEDVAALAEFFAAKHAEEAGRKILGISARALEKLCAYEWPGNIRELENEIRRMVVLTKDGEYVTTQFLSPGPMHSAPRPAPPASGLAAGHPLKEHVEQLERRLVTDTLRRHRWNQSRAADELGLSRVGLANKIRRYRLHESEQ